MSQLRLALVDGDAVFQHGWHSWSPARWVPPAGLRTIGDPALLLTADHPVAGDDPTYLGWGVGGILHPDGEAEMVVAGGLDGLVRLESGAVHPDERLPWASFRGSLPEVLDRAGAELAALWGARRPDPGPVWCSWYSLGPDIDEDLMSGVVDDLSDLPFKVVQVDDGWQTAVGDWVPNSRFGGGMARLAEYIEATGRRAGLWLAPFVAQRDSQLIRSYPEMVLTDPDGHPVVAARNWGPAYALDLSRPDVLEMIAAKLREVVAWGYDYLKLDFLYAGALGPNGEVGYREALEAIRSAVGEERFLLACGAPVVASLGLVDALRVGPDTAPYWEDTHRVRAQGDLSAPGGRTAVSTSVNRLWLGAAVRADPDVVFFRTLHCELQSHQRRMLADLARIAGFLATSDPPAWLEHDERAELERFLTERPQVERLDVHRYLLDGREVDFRPAVIGGEDG